MQVMYPGTFDPITNGHLDVIQRSLKAFDHVIVAVAHNDGKDPLFSVEERVDLIRRCVPASRHKSKKIEVVSFQGLLVDFAKSKKVSLIVRGIRAFSDFEYEFQIALTNRKLDKNIDTIFMMPDEQYSYISSRMIKEICRMGGDISAFVPKTVESALKKKL